MNNNANKCKINLIQTHKYRIPVNPDLFHVNLKLTKIKIGNVLI